MDGFWDVVEWRPGIGDPTVVGWITVFAYLAAGVLALKVYGLGNFAFGRLHTKQKRLWLVVGVLMLFLCVNKQLDLQSLLTDIGRYVFRTFEVYQERRKFQLLFIAAVLISMLIFLLSILLSYRKVLYNHWLAIIGLALVLGYVLIRASSFHHIDRLISFRFIGVKLNWVFELTGIILIIVNAVKLIQKGQRRKKKWIAQKVEKKLKKKVAN